MRPLLGLNLSDQIRRRARIQITPRDGVSWGNGLLYHRPTGSNETRFLELKFITLNEVRARLAPKLRDDSNYILHMVRVFEIRFAL